MTGTPPLSTDKLGADSNPRGFHHAMPHFRIRTLMIAVAVLGGLLVPVKWGGRPDYLYVLAAGAPLALPVALVAQNLIADFRRHRQSRREEKTSGQLDGLPPDDAAVDDRGGGRGRRRTAS